MAREGGAVATWKELCPEGVWPSRKGCGLSRSGRSRHRGLGTLLKGEGLCPGGVVPCTPHPGEAMSGCAEGTRPRWGAGTRVGGTHGYLPRGLDALDEAEEDNNPRDAQAPQEGQPHIAQVPNVIGQVQHIVPAQGQLVSARPTTPSSPLPVPTPGTSSTPRWGWCASGWC